MLPAAANLHAKEYFDALGKSLRNVDAGCRRLGGLDAVLKKVVTTLEGVIIVLKFRKLNVVAVSVIILALAGGSACRVAQAASPAGREHTADMRWWKQARFGMFIHWGIYSQAAGYWQGKSIPGDGAWIMDQAHLTRKA